MSNSKKSRGLGRGLSALMADVTVETEASPNSAQRAEQIVPTEKLVANPDQPRRQFNREDLDDLAASVREKGIIQPLIVRDNGNGTYEIVAGERRWRAAQQAQLHEVPVVVREFTDTEVLEVAIIENIQRADLNAIEEAAGYRQLMDRFGHTQEKMAEALGKSRSHIANLLRLLNLPDDVQDLLRDGKLTAGHARALITSDTPSEHARVIVRDGLSVRATEALMKRQQSKQYGGTDKPAAPVKDADTKALEGDLSAVLGLKVGIDHKAGSESGKLTIHYKDLAQLDDLCARLSNEDASR